MRKFYVGEFFLGHIREPLYFALKFIEMKYLIIFLLLFTASFSQGQTTIDSIHVFTKAQIQTYFNPLSKKAMKWITKLEPEFDIEKYNSYKYDSLFVKMKYEVSAHYVEHNYQLPNSDSIIQCSGALFTPMTDKIKGEIIYVHGTILPQDGKSIPSALRNYYKDTTKFYANVNYPMMMASLGYIVHVPDLLGYGSSRPQNHPFADYQQNGNAIISFYDACQPMIRSKFKGENAVLFTGISEGAGIALGTLRLMEASGKYAIKGASLCAGPYNMYASLEWYFEKERMTAFTTMAYKWSGYTIWKNENRDMNEVFIHPPRKQKSIYSLYDLFFGKRKVKKIYTANIINKVQNSDTEIKNIMDQNSPIYFVPKSEIKLYHGEKDQIVPFVNSITANEYYLSVNANCTLNSFPTFGHVSVVQPYLFGTIEWLDER